MFKKMILIAATIFALTMTSYTFSPALAQGASCADRTIIVERLSSKYGEIRQGAGLTQNNSIIEIFASTETGTWTILMTMPNGTSCMMSAGRSWQSETTSATKPGEEI